MIFAVILIGVGALFSWFALMGWKHWGDEKISLMEAAVLKLSGEEPLPLSRFDHWLHKFQIIMMTLVGPSLLFIGGYSLLRELGIL